MAGTAEVTVTPKRIGGSLAFFLPADLVKRRGIREGVPVRIVINPQGKADVVGILKKGGRHQPFDRHAEEFWPGDD